jgi:hypothetical protein
MNHSFYSADRETHRRTIGTAAVVIVAVAMLGIGVMSKFDRQQGQTSAAVLRAGVPLATVDGGYLIVR